jgi:LysR family transcriptional regulator, hydrogen peroxide-inducible genes activator
MTLTELRYLVAVARERHFGKAAEACFVSQPTLSVAIKKLEDELGVTVFERGKIEIGITPIGERIIGQAQRVLEETATITHIAQQGKDQLIGPLQLGAIYTIGPYLLPHIIPIVHETAPSMPLIIEESYTSRLSERLKHGDLDVIAISLPFDEPGIVTLPVYDEPFFIVAPADHRWRNRDAIDIKELASETLLLLGPGHCFRDQVLSACPACNHTAVTEGSIQKTVQGGSLETIRHMVATGMGVTVLPCAAAAPDHYAQQLLTIRPFTSPAPKRRVALAWRTSFPRPNAIEVIKQAIIASKLNCVTYL